jgi:hypothetical protein
MNYDVYLFSCLLKEFSYKFEQRPYDEQYDIATNEFKKFESSKFNDINKGAYECIVDYISTNIETISINL